MFSLLATTHDPENRFQKLNEIHRRRLSNWNRHTDSLTFVARSHHCHQALVMINNATNDSLVDWIILWALTIQFCWSKHWGYSFGCEIVIEWQIYVWPDRIFCHSDGCKKVTKVHHWTKEPLSKFEFGGGETVIRTAEARNKIMISFHRSRDRTFVLVELSSSQVVWKCTQHTHNYGAVCVDVRKKLG